MAQLTAEQALEEVGADLETGFEGIFAVNTEVDEPLSPVGVFARVPIGADDVAVMAWEWQVRHVGPLQGTPATGREVTMRGVTVIDLRDGDDHQYSRYIDWLALYADLGAVTIARPPVDDRSDLPDETNVPHPVDPESG
jgi:hypothetical protein